MANIIGLTAQGGDKIMVNADQITYFRTHPKGGATAICLAGCEAPLLVREDVYEIAYRIASDPSDIEPPDDDAHDTIARVTNHIIRGSLTPGSRVEIQSVVEYECGDAQVNRLEGTYVDTRSSEFPGNEGVEYHYFSDGTVNGSSQGNFGLPAASFLTPP